MDSGARIITAFCDSLRVSGLPTDCARKDRHFLKDCLALMFGVYAQLMPRCLGFTAKSTNSFHLSPPFTFGKNFF